MLSSERTILNAAGVQLHGAEAALTVSRSAMENRRLIHFSFFGPLTRNGHIPGGCRPLLWDGGPISYQPRPEATLPKPKRASLNAAGVRLHGAAAARGRVPPAGQPRNPKPEA